ncbi:Karyopherin transporter [Neophaeococcomyces mojaviensis]|uniref:Karyopherin transporter n=1 Tax=Neophaeococcomyces mojaviensis TaxID=3383035 RepID=A0ACC3A2M8_9EURO|nr:Karyopherin transporter [Knufia sp. JES_112]
MSVTVGELDTTVRTFQEGKGDAPKQAQQQLNEFKSNPDAWLVVDKILQEAQYMPTKYLGL